MAYGSAFRERLADLETTRNHRLFLLQDEKELQRRKYVLLSAKHAKIRLLEQRCLTLDHKLASDQFKISSLKSEIEILDRKYQSCAQQLRDLKVEVEELEQLDNERETYYAVKCFEMNAFKNDILKFAEETSSTVQELKASRDKLNQCYLGLQKGDSIKHNSHIEAAEMRKSELLSSKQNVVSSLESNKRVRAMLQEQLESLS